jgi:glycosyltransferase involved in cell wall biosynthesis
MNPPPPLVSVIVPTYNRAYCLEETLRTALAQTHRAVELVVVDDGSTDGTRELVERLRAEDGRIRYHHQANRGVAAARNVAMELATGEYLAFLDSDDRWHPWKLELQVRALRHLAEAGMVWTDMTAVDPDDRVVAERYLREMYDAYRWFPGDTLFTDILEAAEWLGPDAAGLPAARLLSGDIYSAMITGNLVHTSTVLLRRDWAGRAGGFPEQNRTGEDYDFHLRTCRLGPVAYLDVASTLYRRGLPDRLTRPELEGKLALAFLTTLETALARDADRITLPPATIRAVRAEANGWTGTVYFDEGRFAEAARYLAASLRQDLAQPRLWLKWLLCQPPPWLTRAAVTTWRRLHGHGSHA